jgi:predicted phosphodiesterase
MTARASLERIALISDLHGNVTAFEAVLADIESRGIRTIHNLGDVVGKGPRGSACVALTRERCAVTVRGNWDDFLPPEVPSFPRDAAFQWWHDELSAEDRQWLLALPLAHHLVLSGRVIRLVHASADSVYTRVRQAHTREEFDGMFEQTELTGDGPTPDVVCYGDVHDAYLETKDSRTLVNVGSVGNPLDHPTASYAILEGVPGDDAVHPFGVQFVRVPYDIEAEIAVAEELRMPTRDVWSIELRTGVFRGHHEEYGLT